MRHQPLLPHHQPPRPLSVASPRWYRDALIAIILSCVFFTAAMVRAEGYNHAPLDALLKKHVKGPSVDYQGLKKEAAALDAYLAPARQFNGRALSGEEGLAFWINMYNAWTLKLILTKYPEISSIKDFGSVFSSPWDKEFVTIGGESLTLGEIEHKILRKEYRDPRIHFAINCASRSCPPILAEAYLPQTLEAQLDRATLDFINQDHNTRIEDGKLFVSRIFKWYKSDFKDTLGYVRQYARGDLAKAFSQQSRSPKVVYMAYDWSLNDTRP